MSSSSTSTLPDSIKIDDIASGKIDPNAIYGEIERLKVEINILRNDMTMFLKSLGSIAPNQSQEAYFRQIYQKLKVVQTSIRDYCSQYNKILPIINLAQIKLGQDVDIVQQENSKTKKTDPKSLQAANSQTNKGGRKQSANGKQSGTSMFNGNVLGSTNGSTDGVNAEQPILL